MATALALPGWVDVQDPATLPPDSMSEAWIPFAHAPLADAEHTANQQVQQHVASWLLWLWPWVAGAMLAWTPRKNAEWNRLIDRAEVPPQVWMQAIRKAWQAGATTAQSPGSPQKGSAPRKPGASIHVLPPIRRLGEPTPHREGLPPRSELPHLTDAQRERAAWMAEITAAAKMREWVDGLKDDVRWQVVRAVKAQWTPIQLAEELSKRWGKAGADWNRIAVTELSGAYHDGLLSHVVPGAVGFIARIHDAKVCMPCRRLLENRYFRLYPTTPLHPTQADWEGALWPGKSNVGRPAKEWVPCLPLHPHCRHLLTVAPPTRKKG